MISSSPAISIWRADVTAEAEDSADPVSEAPERASFVLTALILVAGVANLNLSVANVARPDIGKHFDSSRRRSI